jgi:RNA polymerase sigma factor (sigma-70 family)
MSDTALPLPPEAVDVDGIDPVLLAAYRGEPAALNQLLHTSQPLIRRYALRHCIFEVVDDAVQDSMVVLARRLSTVRALRAFSGWLLQVVRHECHRLGSRLLRHDLWDYTRATCFMAADDVTTRLSVVAALESLPPHYRKVVVLRDIEELGISEIAERLGEPIGAVKSRLHRARELLREYLLA